MGLSLLAPATAAEAANIMIQAKADDTVGQSIVYNLRNQIARSALHKLVYTRDDAGFIINIVTVAGTGGESAYSAVLIMPPLNGKGFDLFVNSFAGICGSAATEACAASILSGMDGEMAKVTSALMEVLKKPAKPPNQ